jgi:hypothetical protein
LLSLQRQRVRVIHRPDPRGDSNRAALAAPGRPGVRVMCRLRGSV